MKFEGNLHGITVTAAVEAIDNMLVQELDGVFHRGQIDAMFAHDEIGLAPITQKSDIFYRHFVPARNQLILLLANSYRQYFKVALAHLREVGTSPEQLAWNRLQSPIDVAKEWIRDWYILACDGENQSVRHSGQISFDSGQTVLLPISLNVQPLPPESWRVPAWLFQISIAYVGVGPLKTKNVPSNDSEERLDMAHTRLFLKGARRVFLWELRATIERVRNEETAAAGAIPETSISQSEEANKRPRPKHWLKGIEGLTRKADLSKYKQGLTEKQELAFSLKYEYEVGPAEIAVRMGIDRKTVAEHIEAANRRIKQLQSNERGKANRAKKTPDL